MAMSAPLDTEFLERRIGQLWVQATDHAKGSAEEQHLEKLAARLLDYVSDQPQMPLPSGDISPDWWPSEPNVVGRSGNQDRKSTRLNSSHIPLSRMPSSACKKK